MGGMKRGRRGQGSEGGRRDEGRVVGVEGRGGGVRVQRGGNEGATKHGKARRYASERKG